MVKIKWRFGDRITLPYHTTIPVVGLVILLLSFHMLPKSRIWSDLLMDRVSSYVAGTTVTSPGQAQLLHSPSGNLSTSPPSQSFAPNTSASPPQSAITSTPLQNESISDSNTAAGESWPPRIADNSSELAIQEYTNRTNDTSTAASAPAPPVAVGQITDPLLGISMSMMQRERYLVPLLSYQVGAGNQFMEFLSAAVIARSLNRTLCLSPFFPGPSRHTGRVTSGLAWEDRYDVALLSRFTRVASMRRCLKECEHTLDDKWMLKTAREPRIDSRWKKYPRNNEALNLKWDYVKWTRPVDIMASLGDRNATCVGMLGLFPGLRWRGAFLAISAFIRPATHINKLADKLQAYALGFDTRYLAVHWRFEESECRGQHVGLCFVRCEDGSVIDSGLHPDAQIWHKATETKCDKNTRFRGIQLNKEDIIDTIHERALNHSIKAIYLATDGWMRGTRSVALLKEVIESLRKRNLIVVGLWKIPGLPNFSDGRYFDPVTTLGKQDLNGAQIGLLEQELCSRAVSFMGSGPSTFSLSVFRVRLARRRVLQMGAAAGAHDDSLVVDTLLRDAHPAGLHCRYLRHMNHARVNETVETYADEFPDGWLDLEACEGRIGRGGRCQVAKCI